MNNSGQFSSGDRVARPKEADVAAYEALPPALRLFIQDAPYNLDCVSILQAWKSGRTIPSLLAEMSSTLEKAVRANILMQYGPTHPHAQP